MSTPVAAHGPARPRRPPAAAPPPSAAPSPPAPGDRPPAPSSRSQRWLASTMSSAVGADHLADRGDPRHVLAQRVTAHLDLHGRVARRPPASCLGDELFERVVQVHAAAVHRHAVPPPPERLDQARPRRSAGPTAPGPPRPSRSWSDRRRPPRAGAARADPRRPPDVVRDRSTAWRISLSSRACTARAPICGVHENPVPVRPSASVSSTVITWLAGTSAPHGRGSATVLSVVVRSVITGRSPRRVRFVLITRSPPFLHSSSSALHEGETGLDQPHELFDVFGGGVDQRRADPAHVQAAVPYSGLDQGDRVAGHLGAQPYEGA